MRRIVLCMLTFVCLLAVQAGHAQFQPLTSISYQNETANNTSACTSNNNPYTYCIVGNGLMPTLPLFTSNANWDNTPTGAQTHIVDALPTHVSTLKIPSLMPKVSGQAWNGKVLCLYEPWFSVDQTTGYNSHIDIDYDENPPEPPNNWPSSVGTQDDVMIKRGCNINFVDFYGNGGSQPFNLKTTDNVYSDLWPRSGYPLQLGILEEGSPFVVSCNASANKADEEACIEAAVENDMAYVYGNYIAPHPGVYWTDNSANVVGFFGHCGDYSPSNIQHPGWLSCNAPYSDDWGTVWSNISQYVSTHYNMKFIFEYGYFGYPVGGLTKCPICRSPPGTTTKRGPKPRAASATAITS